MPRSPTPPDLDGDATIVAFFVQLIHARRTGDFLTAADAHHELARLGVLIRFPRKREGSDR